MRDALVTRGVNSRPQKVRHESRPPRGIAVSSHYAHWQAPARCRPRAILRLEQTAAEHARKVDRLRLEMHQAQDMVRALKGAGHPFADAAQAARKARAEYLTVTGQTPSGSVEVDMGSDANKVKAV